MTIDVATDLSSGQEFHVICAGEKPDVIDLRNTRDEKLHPSGDEVLVLTLP